jgi:hypothetical protein
MVATSRFETSVRAAVIAVGEHWSTAQRRLLRLVVELDESGEWTADGACTCAHWVANALGVEVCTAREWLRIGRALPTLPTIDAAFEGGDLSYSKIRALTRVATSENEAELCRIALRVAAGRLPHALASWLTRHETPEQTETRQQSARRLTSWTEPDGMIAISLRLSPLDGSALMAAIDTKVAQRRPDASADASGRWPSTAQQRADALVELVAGGGAGIEAELVLHVRGDGCTLDDGTPIAGSVIERIAPQTFLRALIHDAERRPINASGRHRHPTRRQKRVVKERDRVCVDCGSSEHLQYDHVPDFEASRRTIVEELWLKCSGCHRDRHRRAGGNA